MTGNIYSSDFFKQIAMSKADINKNSQIDEGEYELNGRKINEKSIFDSELKKFDMNKDGVVDEQDVPLFKNKVELTEEEKQAKKELELFEKQNPDFDIKTASKEVFDKYVQMLNKTNMTKELDENTFRQDVINVAQYLVDTDSPDLDNYWHSISKKTGINNNVAPDNAAGVQKCMDDLTLFVGGMLMNSSKSNESDKIKLANDIATKVINTADMDTNNLHVQKDALMNLSALSMLGVDNKELIEDVKNNLRTIKSNFEQELQTTQDNDEKQWIQDRIAEIDKLIQ